MSIPSSSVVVQTAVAGRERSLIAASVSSRRSWKGCHDAARIRWDPVHLAGRRSTIRIKLHRASASWRRSGDGRRVAWRKGVWRSPCRPRRRSPPEPPPPLRQRLTAEESCGGRPVAAHLDLDLLADPRSRRTPRTASPTRAQELTGEPHVAERRSRADSGNPATEADLQPMKQRLQLPAPLCADEGVQFVDHAVG